MFKAIRIVVLLAILVAVSLSALMHRWQAQSWRRPQVVVLYPIDASGSPATDAYLQRLTPEAFRHLEPFFAAQARQHGLALEAPVQVVLGPRIATTPPPVPRGRSALSAIAWSLHMRWWAWRHTPPTSPMPDVRLYLMYHAGTDGRALPHSTGLEKGRLGVVNLFALRAQEGPNEVVIAHEALHTFGATDKYDPYTLLPAPPDGYASPYQSPLLPQDKAELMAGRIPTSPSAARIPNGLSEVVIGPATAREIGWRQAR